MSGRRRKKYFSLIFVPDQEQNPKSISMSYLRGRVILGVLAALTVHFILGGVGYIRLGRLERMTAGLREENIRLKDENRRIEQIVMDLQEIRQLDLKIRKAFGGSLGLEGYEGSGLGSMELAAREQDRAPLLGTQASSSPVQQVQNGLYFLVEDESHFLGPDYLPTFLPVEGFLTTHFQKGGWFVGRSHLGIDIAAKKGSVIRAAGAGVVLLAGWTPDFGNVVVISHGKGMYSYYGHAMRLMVEQGFRVRKGQPIALLGSSGMTSSAPHLHFEIWKNGEPLDPERILYALPRREPGSES